MAVIELRGVEKRFGQTAAVAGLDLSVEDGETIAILGPSGCGKTTTLRLIAGFETPDRGDIIIGGNSVVTKRPYERNVGLLFQQYALFPHMSVAENVMYGLRRRRWPKADIPDRLDTMLRLVRMDGFAGRRPGELSGGQQQRVALARVLATNPKLVLLDEPLSALDAKLREELRGELKEILGAVHATTVVVTHDQEEAMSLASRIVIMNGGRIEQQGSPDELYRLPESQFVAKFLGKSNWLHGVIIGESSGGAQILVTKHGTSLSILDRADDRARDRMVCIRPEDVVILPADRKTCDKDTNLVPGRIAEVVPLGSQTHYHVDTAEGRFVVVGYGPDRSRDSKGDAVVLSFRREACVTLPC